VILDFVLLTYVGDRLAHASWLTEEEKNCVETQLAQERRELEAIGTCTLRQSLTKIPVVAVAVIYLAIVAASGGL
jgi:hypothetical protein